MPCFIQANVKANYFCAIQITDHFKLTFDEVLNLHYVAHKIEHAFSEYQNIRTWWRQVEFWLGMIFKHNIQILLILRCSRLINFWTSGMFTLFRNKIWYPRLKMIGFVTYNDRVTNGSLAIEG